MPVLPAFPGSSHQFIKEVSLCSVLLIYLYNLKVSFLSPSDKQNTLHISQKSSALDCHIFKLLKTIPGSPVSAFQLFNRPFSTGGRLTAPVSSHLSHPWSLSNRLCWLNMPGTPLHGLVSFPWMNFFRALLTSPLSCEAILHPFSLSASGRMLLPLPSTVGDWWQNNSQLLLSPFRVVKILTYCHAPWQITAAPKAPKGPIASPAPGPSYMVQ